MGGGERKPVYIARTRMYNAGSYVLITGRIKPERIKVCYDVDDYHREPYYV